MENGICSGDHSIKTAFMNIYDEYVDTKHLFERKHQLFTLSLVYGILFAKISEKKLDTDVVKIVAGKDEETTSVIDIIGYLLDDGKKEENKMWRKI